MSGPEHVHTIGRLRLDLSARWKRLTIAAVGSAAHVWLAHLITPDLAWLWIATILPGAACLLLIERARLTWWRFPILWGLVGASQVLLSEIILLCGQGWIFYRLLTDVPAESVTGRAPAPIGKATKSQGRGRPRKPKRSSREQTSDPTGGSSMERTP